MFDGHTDRFFMDVSCIVSSNSVSPTNMSYTDNSTSFVIPNPLVAFPCGSVSINKTFFPFLASIVLKFTVVGNLGVLLQEPLFDNGVALAVALGNQAQLVKLLLPLVGLVVEQNVPLHVVVCEATVALLLVVAADGAGHYMEALVVLAGPLQEVVFLGTDNLGKP